LVGAGVRLLLGVAQRVAAERQGAEPTQNSSG